MPSDRKRRARSKSEFSNSEENMLRLHLRGENINMAIKYLGWAMWPLFGWLSIRELAGRETSAGFALLIDAVMGAGINKWLAWVLAGAGVTYGAYQKRERRRTTARLGNRIGELEKRIDANRSSSMLAPTGTEQEERL